MYRPRARPFRRPHRHRPARTGRVMLVLAFALLVLLAPGHALAQQRYELSEGQWHAQPQPDPDTPEGQILAIRQQLAADQPKRAQALAERWMKRHGDHPRLVEVRLLHGDALVGRQHDYEALYDYEWIIRYRPESEQYHTALDREYQIAQRFINGVNRRFLGLRILPAESEGEELLIRIQERAPGTELAERASLTLADYYYNNAEMASAAEAYELFLENYPQSEHREPVLWQLIRANLARFKGPAFDPTGLIEAEQRLKDYRQAFPAAAARRDVETLLVRTNESLALKIYQAAQWHEQRNEPVAAGHLYQRLIREHPQTAVAERAVTAIKQLPASVRRGLDLDMGEQPEQIARPAGQADPSAGPGRIQPPASEKQDGQ